MAQQKLRQKNRHFCRFCAYFRSDFDEILVLECRTTANAENIDIDEAGNIVGLN